jgi:hypothetical protein
VENRINEVLMAAIRNDENAMTQGGSLSKADIP